MGEGVGDSIVVVGVEVGTLGGVVGVTVIGFDIVGEGLGD